MTSRLNRWMPLLKRLKKKGYSGRDKLLKSVNDDEFFMCVCDCAANVLKSNVPLKKRQFNALARHKKILRKLANTKISLKSKKKGVLKQTGGFLLPLLAPIIAACVQGLIFH